MDKETVIVVDRVDLDNYGNLKVFNKGGGETRVNKKHDSLHHLFVPGKAIKLTWGEYLGKEYVDDATLVEGELPPSQTPKILPEHQEEIDKARASVRPTKDLAVCLTYAKDLAIAGKIKLCDIFVWAEALYTFISGNMGIGDEQVTELIMKLLREATNDKEVAKKPIQKAI